MIDDKILKNEERAVYVLRSLYKKYGYLPFKMSKFEEYDVYVANKEFLVSDRVITFNDTNGKLLALKPDVTLSIIKNTRSDDATKNKVYYNENVYRVSGSTGQFKEIMQTGLECIGDVDVTDVYEVLLLAAKSLATVSDNYILDISHMGILTAILDEASDSEFFKKEATSLIAEKNSHGLSALCKKASIDSNIADKLISLTSMYGTLKEVENSLRGICMTDASRAALSQLSLISSLFENEDFYDKLRFDFSVVNNMNYYDGIVFKGFLDGICEGVLSGGEYGKLLRRMGRKCSAVGFALYLDLLSELDIDGEEYDVDVLLLYNDGTACEKIIEMKKQIADSGRTVSAQKALPKKIRYREVVEI